MWDQKKADIIKIKLAFMSCTEKRNYSCLLPEKREKSEYEYDEVE